MESTVRIHVPLSELAKKPPEELVTMIVYLSERVSALEIDNSYLRGVTSLPAPRSKRWGRPPTVSLRAASGVGALHVEVKKKKRKRRRRKAK